MNHSFDVEIARLHGVDAAILIENFRFWIAKNKANGRHYYDGRWWTYNSTKALSELFPYWSGKQIERTLSRMKSDGIMVTGHYSQNAYDRTNWYSIQEDALPQIVHSISRIREMEEPVFGKCTDTDIGTDINTYRESTPRKRSAPPVMPDGVDQQVWSDWIALRKAKRAPVTQTVINGAIGEAAKAGMSLEDFLRVWCSRGSQGLEAAWLKPDERTATAIRTQPQPKSFAQQEREAGWARWEQQTNRQHPDRLAYEARNGGGVVIDMQTATSQQSRISQ